MFTILFHLEIHHITEVKWVVNTILCLYMNDQTFYKKKCSGTRATVAVLLSLDVFFLTA